MTTINDGLREPLMDSLAAIAANLYDEAFEGMIPPFLCVVPADPYIEPTSMASSTARVRVNFELTGGVQYFSNAAALDNIEQLMISAMKALPSGYSWEIGDVSKPTRENVGPSPVLTASVTVSGYTTNL